VCKSLIKKGVIIELIEAEVKQKLCLGSRNILIAIGTGAAKFNKQVKFSSRGLLGSIKKQSGLEKAIQQTELVQVFFYFSQGISFLYFWSGFKSISPC
jgi:hypothetical protein